VYPEEPVPNSVAILRPYNMQASHRPLECDPIVGGDVINAQFVLTDERAAGVFYGLAYNNANKGVSSAFHFNKDFTKVDYVIDAGNIQEKIDSNALHANPLTIVMFQCYEIPIYNMEDSSLISTMPIIVNTMLPLDAGSDTSPDMYGLTGVESSFSSKLVNPTAGAPAAEGSELAARRQILVVRQHHPSVDAERSRRTRLANRGAEVGDLTDPQVASTIRQCDREEDRGSGRPGADVARQTATLPSRRSTRDARP